MIAVCPKCRARYRVDTTRIAPEGVKLRCAQCTALFLVRVPNAPVAALPGALPGASSTSSASQTERASSPGPTPPPAPNSAPDNGIVVVADADSARGKRCVEALRAWGVAAHLVHDGVETMLAIQRLLPRAIVLSPGLSRMSGAEVCEIVKRNASLRSTPVVMIASAQLPSSDRRGPLAGFGADAELEPADLPDGLRPILERCGLVAAKPPENRPAPTAVAAPSATVAPPRAAGASPAPADPLRDEERERARRLARIAVSEMLLYQPEKFAEACRTGTLERVLQVELQEARALIRQRIGPEVRAEADFVLEELERVARERGGRA